MARSGVQYDDVRRAIDRLLQQGEAPSVQKIREVLGTGSFTTINEHFREWRLQREENRDQPPLQAIPEPVDPLAPTPEETEALNAWLSARLYLTMRADFDQAAYIDLGDPAVSAALDFYIAWGLLAPERKAEVLANEQPA